MSKNTQINSGIAISQPTSGETNIYIPSGTVDLDMLAARLRRRLLPIGCPIPYLGTTAPDGYIIAQGSIGNIGSGATRRAAADTQELYAHFWDNLADTEAPVAGGRGVSAAADFAAGKALTLPILNGRVLTALDNLGGVAANVITNAISGIATATTLGAAGGVQGVTLTGAQSGVAPHGHAITDPGHNHDGPNSKIADADGGSITTGLWQGVGTQGVTVAATGITIQQAAAASASQAHPNVQPSLFVNILLAL